MDISTFPYFIWRDMDSRQYGIWVSQYPDRVRATERVKTIIIPGREGQLTYTEGEAVYEPLPLTVRVQTLKDSNFDQISEWLSGSGLVVFGNDPYKARQARIIDEVRWTPYSKDIYESIISFVCNPFKQVYPIETPTVLTAAGTVVNSGNVPSKPLIKLTYSSSTASVTVNSKRFSCVGAAGVYEIDSAAQMVTRIIGSTRLNVLSLTSGDFPILNVGSNSVTFTGTITRAEFYPNARWK